MSILYLLDTNIISEPLKVNPDQKVLDFLKLNENKTALCSPVLHELKYEADRLPTSRKKSFILEYINSVVIPSLPIFPYESESAVIHAGLRAKLEAKGKTIGFVDSSIASIAIANNLILVTRNIKDFENIEGLKFESRFYEC